MEYKKSDTQEIIKHLSKYFRRSKNREVYVLMIIKNDWDGNENSYIIRYAKENTKSISTVKHLIEVIGIDLEDAVYKMYLKVNELSKIGKIRGKEWIGNVEYEIDILKTNRI